MSRIALVVLALAAAACAQTGSQYVEMTPANMASTLVSSKPLVIAIGVRSWEHNTEMDHALFMAAQNSKDLKYVRAENTDVGPLVDALGLRLPAYLFVSPSCDKVVISIGLKNDRALAAFVDAGRHSCGAAENPLAPSISRKQLLAALGIPDKTVTGLGFEYAIDKPLAGIVVGAPDEGEKLMRPVVVSAEKPLIIKGVAHGSPADLAGIHAGDRVTAIGGVTVDGATIEQITERVRAAAGKMALTIAPKSGNAFTVTLRAAEYLPVYQ